MTGQVLREIRGAVMTLTLDNPGSRNAITLPMSTQLCEALREAALDPAIRVVVLTGSGGAFCAGGDVKAMAAGRDAGLSVEQRANQLRDRAESVRLLHDMAKPTVAVIPGAVAGAGLGLALACDFRFAASDVKLTTAFARVGLAGDFGVNWLLTRILGIARARELMMFAPVLGAQEALEMGLLTKDLPSQELSQKAGAMVAELAAGPTIAYGHIKQVTSLAAAAAFAPTIEAEALHQACCMITEDHTNAARAFAEKRPPVFNGR
jgi:2-(1,2-epoxy-1,2-dihydrophenyl)acetyl-CoA isomerase